MIPLIQLETSGSELSAVDMVVQRCDSPGWLRDDDDDFGGLAMLAGFSELKGFNYI